MKRLALSLVTHHLRGSFYPSASFLLSFENSWTTSIRRTTQPSCAYSSSSTAAFLSNQGISLSDYPENIDMSKIPSPPFGYLSNQKFLDLSQLDALLSESNDKRQKAYDLGSQIKSAVVHCRASLEQTLTGDQRKELQQNLDKLIQQALKEYSNDKSAKDNLRQANLGHLFGDYIRIQAYQHFLKTGTLLPPSSLEAAFTDEEYLSGVLSFINFDMKRYVIGRATQRDASSVILARDLVSSMLDHLMKYDFRNGNLRRKYDGVKYALKTCETILYELSVTGCEEVIAEQEKRDVDAEPAAKRSKVTSSVLPNDELEGLRERMVQRDELREQLIKKSRDGQKAAKQAIYALHREDFDGAAKLISQCEKSVLEDLQPIVDQEPQLRYGSFANVLEEYAEARLFHEWLVGKEAKDEDSKNPAGKILLHGEFTTVSLEPAEYLGGLCDLTGEIGRYAVKRATVRDNENVQNCLETNMAILFAMESLSKLPGNMGKKIDPLRRTVEKQERMLYELSLVQATGRNTSTGIEEEDSSPK